MYNKIYKNRWLYETSKMPDMRKAIYGCKR